jgi:hypothetical protein
VNSASFALCDIAALLEAVGTRLGSDPRWHSILDRIDDPDCSQRAHLAVLNEPYLSYIMERRKTIESRFSRRRVAPFDQVRDRDLLLLKCQSGPVIGVAEVAHSESYVLDPQTWGFIRERFSAALCAEDPDFWAERSKARYATLMKLSHVMPILPIEVEKNDRRPWVVLGDHSPPGVGRDQLTLTRQEPKQGLRLRPPPKMGWLPTDFAGDQLELLT